MVLIKNVALCVFFGCESGVSLSAAIVPTFFKSLFPRFPAKANSDKVVPSVFDKVKFQSLSLYRRKR